MGERGGPSLLPFFRAGVDLAKEERPIGAGGQEADCNGFRRQADCLRDSGKRLCGTAGISGMDAGAEDISLMSL